MKRELLDKFYQDFIKGKLIINKDIAEQIIDIYNEFHPYEESFMDTEKISVLKKISDVYAGSTKNVKLEIIKDENPLDGSILEHHTWHGIGDSFISEVMLNTFLDKKQVPSLNEIYQIYWKN